MKLIRVGTAVLNQTPLDWRQNRRNISQAIAESRARDVTLLSLPELCIPGYGCDDAYQSPGVQEKSLEQLFAIADETRGMVVALGLPIQYRKALFNCVAVLAGGEVLGFVAKRYLAGDGLYYEPRWFKPWPERRLGEVDVGGKGYPIGDLFFRCDGVNLGLEICEEAWTFKRPGSALAARGVDVILNPSASHFAFGKHEIRRRFVLEGSRAFGVSYIYSNLLGNAAGRMIFDGGAMIASDGVLLAEGRRFGYGQVELIDAVIDVDKTRMRQVRTGSFIPDLEPHPGERVVARGFHFPDLDPETQHDTTAPRDLAHVGGKEEEFTRATALALFDYLRKSRSRGFVVSLSGGADSAATSVLCATMVHLVVQDLGLEAVKARLDHMDLSTVDSAADLVRRLLLCVYQATRNSSETTESAARQVAEGIGAEFMVLDVDPLVAGYTRLVEDAIGRELTWEGDDLALQNIQARVRAPSVWMLANLRGALLLSTSNRSEAAVGYATMDGDTAGGLSPIAGIDKAFLRRWLRWMEVEGPRGLEPVGALAAVNRLEPTAELRPSSADQTDEADLMPYDLLDAIERQAIGDKKVPVEVYRTMRAAFPDYGPRQLATWIERFFRLWCRNQWKRERYAPSFHVDDENLDPKTWCRFPILSGGYDVELEEMWRRVEAET
ncbi:MAG: NAD(+) synthase [Thermoanaerobaculia bacterium]|nr:NAD(+) synthase [Thermoanaerobaculia bacterium]